MSDTTTTVRIKGLNRVNEKEAAQFRFDQALGNMIKSPTRENIQIFEEANRHLYEVQDAYRIGARLLMAWHQARAIFARKNHNSYNETNHIKGD